VPDGSQQLFVCGHPTAGPPLIPWFCRQWSASNMFFNAVVTAPRPTPLAGYSPEFAGHMPPIEYCQSKVHTSTNLRRPNLGKLRATLPYRAMRLRELLRCPLGKPRLPFGSHDLRTAPAERSQLRHCLDVPLSRLPLARRPCNPSRSDRATEDLPRPGVRSDTSCHPRVPLTTRNRWRWMAVRSSGPFLVEGRKGPTSSPTDRSTWLVLGPPPRRFREKAS
jgi:hypothetical protein